MALTTLLKIDGVTIPNIKDFSVAREALWTNANRNMAGELKATLIGYYPKITVAFTVMGKDDMNDLIALLEQPSFTVEWYDEKTQTVKSGLYYAGTYTYSVLDKERELYKEFTANLIPYKKYV